MLTPKDTIKLTAKQAKDLALTNSKSVIPAILNNIYKDIRDTCRAGGLNLYTSVDLPNVYLIQSVIDPLEQDGYTVTLESSEPRRLSNILFQYKLTISWDQ